MTEETKSHGDQPSAPPGEVLSTMRDDGSRRWLRPKISKGFFLKRRTVVAWVLMALFTITPFIKVGGKPLFLFELSTRRFIVFGTTFHADETLPLAFLMLTTFVAIILMTALLGRVWCGWACPQTVYMEFLYRPIERFFEG
ncbi:MAG: 4Fe-4S binding protein, partial [Planctomycetes bacterium]|nr:4Fe-4S binding protein [Planctomycetota bacterium]